MRPPREKALKVSTFLQSVHGHEISFDVIIHDKLLGSGQRHNVSILGGGLLPRICIYMMGKRSPEKGVFMDYYPTEGILSAAVYADYRDLENLRTELKRLLNIK